MSSQPAGTWDRTMSDARFAVEVAVGAAEVLRRLRVEAGDMAFAELKDLGDRRSQDEIARRLAAGRPDDAVLTEEAADDPIRLRRDRVWIIDPLDGTREYAEGRTDWAVHVALWQRTAAMANDGPPGGDVTAAAVALPAEGVVLSSADVVPFRQRRQGPIRIAVSRSRPPAIVEQVVDRLAAAGMAVELVPMGSAGVKIAAVIRGQVDAYLHGGGQYEWDSAAPVCVALAAGAHASRLDGRPLVYNQPDPYLPDLVVCRPELAELLLGTLRTVVP